MTITSFFGLATPTTVFGASVSLVGSLLVRNISLLTVIGGLGIIIFGILSFFGKGFTGIQFQDRPTGTVAGSYIYGATFAIGWTARIGPILGAIYTLLITQGVGVYQGAFLAFIYAVGLGFPEILISSFFSRLGNGSRFCKIIKGQEIVIRIGKAELFVHTTGVISGVLLICIRIILLSGQLATVTQLATGSEISGWVVGMDDKIRILFGIQ